MFIFNYEYVIIKVKYSRGYAMNQELLQKVAMLESKSDVLEAELMHLDTLLKKSGFSEGIETLRGAVEELLSHIEDSDSSEEGLFA